ncbi:hypothetical protein RQP53_16365 [Paucibacter sp. APW11]|uniref:EamA domain-containing protein n=1 Tax=Roseateles aquae TaxID=3077235 RepID=A0ABU3PE38_9BURK|nr:hypothetical protein [Paucibacter sp. APW11]MDT9000851.1 hypothetical protein [Paucibacter sp. APW11]
MKNRVALVAFGGTAVAAGVLMPAHPVSRYAVLLGQAPTIIAWVLLYLWYKSDVASRGLVTSTRFNGFVIAFSFIAMPVYLIRSRGLLRGFVQLSCSIPLQLVGRF